MKNWYLLLLVGLAACTRQQAGGSAEATHNSAYTMRCETVRESWFERCENSEVVCYNRHSGSPFCFMKK